MNLNDHIRVDKIFGVDLASKKNKIMHNLRHLVDNVFRLNKYATTIGFI